MLPRAAAGKQLVGRHDADELQVRVPLKFENEFAPARRRPQSFGPIGITAEEYSNFFSISREFELGPFLARPGFVLRSRLKFKRSAPNRKPTTVGRCSGREDMSPLPEADHEIVADGPREPARRFPFQ